MKSTDTYHIFKGCATYMYSPINAIKHSFRFEDYLEEEEQEEGAMLQH